MRRLAPGGGARRAQRPLDGRRCVRRRGHPLRARRGSPRPEQPDDVQRRRGDHGERLCRRGVRWARLDPTRAPRRLRPRHPRAVRRRLHRSPVQPRHRARRDAGSDRLALTGRDRGRRGGGARRRAARPGALAVVPEVHADRRRSRGRVLDPLPALDVRCRAVQPDGAIRARHDRTDVTHGIRGSDLPGSGSIFPHRCVHVRHPHRRPRPGASPRPGGGHHPGPSCAGSTRRHRSRGGADRRAAPATPRPLPRVRDARPSSHRLLSAVRSGQFHRRSVRNLGDRSR